jgi:hypothetical protein
MGTDKGNFLICVDLCRSVALRYLRSFEVKFGCGPPRYGFAALRSIPIAWLRLWRNLVLMLARRFRQSASITAIL